jgi:hypothetical protein
MRIINLIAVFFILSLQSFAATKLESGTFILEFARDGKPLSFQVKSTGQELLDLTDPGDGFFLEDVGGNRTLLTNLTWYDNKLTAVSENGTQSVVFSVNEKDAYLHFEIVSLKGIPRNCGLFLSFEMNCQDKVKPMETDYMTTARVNDGKLKVTWHFLWNRDKGNPLGSFALYYKKDDSSEDDIILRIWVDENLPHPDVPYEWTFEKAKQWVVRWQEMFADQSEFILEADNLQDLYEGVKYAEMADAKQILLFTNTWRVDFWPHGVGHIQLRKDVFPRGEEDLKAFSDFLRTKGMYLKLHYLSGSLAKDDPEYVAQEPDRRLASWGQGMLAEDAGVRDSILFFKPDPGVELPFKVGPVRTYLPPPALDRVHGFHNVRVGNEIIYVTSFEKTDQAVWILKGCKRGMYSTLAATHEKNTDVAGLIDTYGQNFVPGNDNGMSEEIARKYAEFCNRCGVYNVVFDGFENHAFHGIWGSEKYASFLYSALKHPTTSYTSSGTGSRCWIEYRLNSTKKLMKGFRFSTHASRRAPVILDSPDREASKLLDAQYELSHGAAVGASSYGFCKPQPMFGLTVKELETYGLTSQMASLVKEWKYVSKYMTEDQREILQKSLVPNSVKLPDRTREKESEFVYCLSEINETEYQIKPVKILTREEGDINWSTWQERGPIEPKQFIKLGDTLCLNNPFKKQSPSFIIRVLHAVDYTSDKNVKLQPHVGELTDLIQKSVIIEDTKIDEEGNALVFSYANDRNKELWNANKLPSWNSESRDFTKLRTIGMYVTGDNSGSVLLFQFPKRDYAIKLNFTGKRYIEIPNGEAAWANGYWGWRKGTHHGKYKNIQKYSLGFGYMPPQTHSKVKVEGLKALNELPVQLKQLVITTSEGEIKVKGRVKSGEYITYSGGSIAKVYDKNWNELRELPVEKTNWQVPEGYSNIVIGSDKTKLKPWLEVQVMTEGKGFVVNTKRKIE